MQSSSFGWPAGSKLFQWSFIHGYPLMIFLGVIVATLTVVYFWKRYKYPWEVLEVLIIIVIPMSIIGAKFYTLVVDGGWSTWYQLQGLSIYGALIFAIPSGVGYIWTRRHVVDVRTVLSIIVPTILIGQALGRWGNFFNHEVYGRVVSSSSLDWMTFLKSNMLINGEYRQPIFFYESMLSLLGYLIIVWVLNFRAWIKPGTGAGLYLIWYGIVRLILQLFRDPSQTSFIGNSDVPLNLVVSAIVIALGAFMVFWFEVTTRPYYGWAKKIFPEKFLNKFKKEYERIHAIKPRRPFFFGKSTKKKGKYLLYFGHKVDNIVYLWIPKNTYKKDSKRTINKRVTTRNK